MLQLNSQPAESRLLILLAKTVLKERERAMVQELAPQIQDWNNLAVIAHRKFSLPLLRQHIKDMKLTPLIPDDLWYDIEDFASDSAMRNLKLVSSQLRFKKQVLAPLGIPGIYFKGVNIASRFFPDLGLRPCRDIDVLVPKGSLETIVRHAMKEGYTAVAPSIRMRELTSDRDIRAIVRYSSEVALIAPNGSHIDLQDHLNKYSGIFSSYDVFGNSVDHELGGHSFATLPPAFLFNYLCHHHSRHTWSRLHWLSDLDAIVRSDEFDEVEALSVAKDLGQLGTAEAGLELAQLMSTVTTWDDTDELSRGKAFLKLALQNLPGDMELEKSIGMNLIGGEFMFDWQADERLLKKARRNWWRAIFKPTLKQYDMLPLPGVLQGIYYPMRLVQLGYLTQERLRSS